MSANVDVLLKNKSDLGSRCYAHKCQLKDLDPAIWTTERDEGCRRTLDVGLLKSADTSMKLLKLTVMMLCHVERVHVD